MFLPFSSRGIAWEPKAGALRKLARIGPSEQLDPWSLAPKVGLHVIEATPDILDALSVDCSSTLRGMGRFCWSGGVYAQPLPNGRRLCILNPTHSHRRNRITLMEEISHVYLRHKPSELILHGDGVEVRDYNHAQEQEAYGVGAAALLPWELIFRAIDVGKDDVELADAFNVTPELIRYRINICGAFRLYRARQRAKTTPIAAR